MRPLRGSRHQRCFWAARVVALRLLRMLTGCVWRCELQERRERNASARLVVAAVSTRVPPAPRRTPERRTLLAEAEHGDRGQEGPASTYVNRDRSPAHRSPGGEKEDSSAERTALSVDHRSDASSEPRLCHCRLGVRGPASQTPSDRPRADQLHRADDGALSVWRSRRRDERADRARQRRRLDG